MSRAADRTPQLNELLGERAHPRTRRQRWIGALASVGLHVVLLVAFLVAPVLAARQREPIEFIPVRIVPVQALGVPEPERRQPAPATEAPKPVAVSEEKPKPAPPRPAPETARKPQPEPAPGAQGTQQRQGSPFGSATGGSAFGAVAGFDNPDFVYNYYVEQMLASIGAHWVRPPVGGGVQAILRFRIGSRGEVSEIELLESSGHTSFDVAGLRAIERASPLPPLPRSYPHDSLGVRLVIR